MKLLEVEIFKWNYDDVWIIILIIRIVVTNYKLNKLMCVFVRIFR